jgi:hypothetical protein
MEQTAVQKFLSDCGEIALFVKNEVSLGTLHDFLMALKGNIVERMVKAQKEEEAHAEAVKKQEQAASEEKPSPCCEA